METRSHKGQFYCLKGREATNNALMTCEEVAKELGITASHVRVIECRALKKLKHNKLLREYWR